MARRTCFICDKEVQQNGKPVVRLEQGVLEDRGWGAKLIHLDFEDYEAVKWSHWNCLKRKPHYMRVAHLKETHCVLCGRGFEYEGDGFPGECVLLVERGRFDDDGCLVAAQGGHVHFVCAVMEEEHWVLPLRDFPRDI